MSHWTLCEGSTVVWCSSQPHRTTSRHSSSGLSSLECWSELRGRHIKVKVYTELEGVFFYPPLLFPSILFSSPLSRSLPLSQVSLHLPVVFSIKPPLTVHHSLSATHCVPLTVRGLGLVTATKALCLQSQVTHHELFNLCVVEPQPAARGRDRGLSFFCLLWNGGRTDVVMKKAVCVCVCMQRKKGKRERYKLMHVTINVYINMYMYNVQYIASYWTGTYKYMYMSLWECLESFSSTCTCTCTCTLIYMYMHTCTSSL